jgi:radical SAM-linked protein
MMARIRIRFAKLGKIRWTSHRDTARMWERAFRRIELPLAYTNGFSPRPKVSFGLALPTGYESLAEYLDIELADGGVDAVDVESLPTALSAALPMGVDAVAAAAIEARAPSLQEDVTLCTWECTVADPSGTPADFGASLAERAGELLDASEVVVTRQRKGTDVTDDIRPAILSLRLLDETPEGVRLECDLATQPRSLRPSELVAALGPEFEPRHLRRLHQWIQRDGARWEPLGSRPAATDAPHALERVS